MTCNLQLQHFLLHIDETTQYRLYKIFMKNRPLVKTEAYGGQHPKYHHHALSGIFQELVHFIIINWFYWSGIQIWNIVWARLKWILWRINLYITIIKNMMIRYTHDSQKKQDCYWEGRSWNLIELLEIGCSNLMVYQLVH